MCGCSLPQTAPRTLFASTATATTFGVFIVCRWLSIRAWGIHSPIGPSLVLCLIHCRSPTPSATYFALHIFDLQSWSLATSREVMSPRTTSCGYLRLKILNSPCMCWNLSCVGISGGLEVLWKRKSSRKGCSQLIPNKVNDHNRTWNLSCSDWNS